MTREEILKLEPGPELDRLVAEKVMGWEEGKDFDCSEEGTLIHYSFRNRVLGKKKVVSFHRHRGGDGGDRQDVKIRSFS